MPRLRKVQIPLFTKLVGDCIAYNLNGQAAVVYVRSQLETDVPLGTINRYKVKLQSNDATREWYSEFARVRFVKEHAQIIDDLKRSYNDTNEQIFRERLKSPRNESLIIKLKTKLEETAQIRNQFASDTPVIDAIRQKIEGHKQEKKEFNREAPELEDASRD